MKTYDVIMTPSNDGNWVLKSEADKVIAHNKFKRCLWVVEMLEHICPITIRKAKWKGKWHMRWLGLAEKFKEVEK